MLLLSLLFLLSNVLLGMFVLFVSWWRWGAGGVTADAGQIRVFTVLRRIMVLMLLFRGLGFSLILSGMFLAL